MGHHDALMWLAACAEPAAAAPALVRGIVEAIDAEGGVEVALDGGAKRVCDVLLAGFTLEPGDAVLVARPGAGMGRAVVLGRVGRYKAPEAPARLELEATESLSLRCGEARVELRADGRLMLRGEDVLLRAKGTQRIRAGHVAIN
ncbi:MAG: hypothetical protein KGL43_13870 [Burkholderiales bacterium]|nr:hypothetical protein [Burkholderiales bacterium]